IGLCAMSAFGAFNPMLQGTAAEIQPLADAHNRKITIGNQPAQLPHRQADDGSGILEAQQEGILRTFLVAHHSTQFRSATFCKSSGRNISNEPSFTLTTSRS